MTKDQQHHVMGLMWNAIIDLIAIIEDGTVLTVENQKTIDLMKNVFYRIKKEENEKVSEEV